MSDKSKTPDKLEKFLAGGDITLNCFISDEGVNDIFKVTILTIEFLLLRMKSETVV